MSPPGRRLGTGRPRNPEQPRTTHRHEHQNPAKSQHIHHLPRPGTDRRRPEAKALWRYDARKPEKVYPGTGERLEPAPWRPAGTTIRGGTRLQAGLGPRRDTAVTIVLRPTRYFFSIAR